MKKDYIWNTLGSIVFAISFPLLTIIVTRIQGAENAGMFSIAFATAQMLMIIGNYAVRAYQVSDIKDRYSFSEYQIQRYISCLLMMIFSIGYSLWRGYQGKFFVLVVMLCFFKMIDALADVYESELQRKNFLYKAGISIFWRTLSSIIIFAAILVFTKDMMIATMSMCTISIMFLILFAVIPIKKMERQKEKISIKSILEIFIQCFPLFLSLFLLGYINNSPKYALEGIMAYEYQTYFNALYFPSQVIYMFTGFVFKPMLLQMAEYWNNGQRENLVLLIKKVLSFIVLLTAVGMFLMYVLGIPILSFIFGINLKDYRGQAVSMLIAGGLIAIVNFMYHILTVMRKQNILMVIYIIVYIISLILPIRMVKIGGMWGACSSYILLLGMLVVLLIIGFIKTKLNDISSK